MTEKEECFVIQVSIIEGRHFTILNMDSIAHVQIGKQTKSTGVRKSTDSPYFNEMVQPRKIWRRRRTIGCFNLDIATVWTAPDHQFYHKWAVITAGFNDKKPGPKGYLKIDVGILTKGNVPHIPITVETTTDDDIERNLLLPGNVLHDRTRANFIFNVYNAEEIPKIKSSGCKKFMDYLPSTYVRITFAGLIGKTQVQKNTQNPVWNERIIFTELFPSLCQRIKIELKHTQNAPDIIHYLYLKSICNDEENGFLPTFGPSYIHLYTSEYSEVNYHGKLLLEMKTEILTDLMWSTNSVDIYPIRTLPNLLRLWKIEPILLFCNIYSVTMLDKKFREKQISFEMTMGGPVIESTSIFGENISAPMKPVPDNKQYYYYLPNNDQVMCLSILSNNLNDTRRGIFNTNMMQKIYQLLKLDLNKIEELFEQNYKKHKEEINSLFLQVAEKLEINCRKYLSIVRASPATKIDLDEKKLQHCIKKIEDIEKNISKIIHHQSKKKVYRKLLSILHMIYNLIDDVQYCWPDIFIWMLSGNKRIGYYRVQVKEIIFSKNPEERGLLCGTLQYIYIIPSNKTKIKLTFGENSAILCRMCVQLWIGLMNDKEECLKSVSNCYNPLEMSEIYDIPKIFLCNEIHYVTCKVYLYQGRFEPGADNSGLSDPYIKIILNEHMQKSKAIPNTIHPVWDETVIFKNIALYGSIEFLSANTPEIVLEAYDHDILVQSEFLGRCVLVPEISLAPNTEKIVKLHWVQLYNGDRHTGELLVAAEFILMPPGSTESLETKIYITMDTIPENIKPVINSFRLDVYFWGVRDLRKIHLRNIAKPKITIECGGTTLHSTTIQNTKKYLNFSKPHQSIIVNIPENEEFSPPLSINMFDCRGCGWYFFVGTNLSRLQHYIYKPVRSSELVIKMNETNFTFSTDSSIDSGNSLQEICVNKNLKRSKRVDNDARKYKLRNWFTFNKLKRKLALSRKARQDTFHTEEKAEGIDIDILDWWTKFYLSTENSEIIKNMHLREKLKIKIYPCELEQIKDFNNFNDLLHTFKLYRGKRTGDEVLDEENIIAIFKGAIRIYRWPLSDDDSEEYVTETGHSLQNGAFQHYPVNEPVAYLARVYVIRALKLRPKDLSGKSDPYLIVKLGDNEIVDKENYVANEINPVFGRCFELKGVFPRDNMLTIEVWDWDISFTDDFIGETKIDLENRLYTNHRANCGLPIMYIERGPCAWRDQYKPSQILQILCRRNKLNDPEYFKNTIKVGPCIFTDIESENTDQDIYKEILSLMALNNWKSIPLVGCALVPEHVETRSLYHYSKPGMEQGKLQLWVDVFPSSDLPPPPCVDVKPHAPQPYELHVIIWNTDDVILEEDDFFVGARKSDIYVKGWLTDPEDSQCTDVHYNSISGEGNFNWRFVFPFLYLSAEEKIVIKKKTSVFSVDETEYKLPCYLNLQVWDNDTFSADDFLGSLKLSLNHLPRGAKTAKQCTLNILKPSAPTVNLFKTKRHKGWWPFLGKKAAKKNTNSLTGKVEIEIQVLTEEEYRLCPAGLGRSDPQALPAPKRPDVSFSWFLNPLKTLKFMICRRFRCKCILLLILSILIFMVFVFIYAFPNYFVKRFIGA